MCMSGYMLSGGQRITFSSLSTTWILVKSLNPLVVSNTADAISQIRSN